MHAPSKILVPVDFSECSRAALDYAALLAVSLGADVDVLHVWRPPVGPSSQEDLLTHFARSVPGHKMMEWLVSFDLGAAIEAHGRLATAEQSAVPEAIVDVAESGEYDLVVMGTKAHHRLAHPIRGSVTQNVMRRSPCPVVMVRAAALPDDVPRPDTDIDVTTMWSWPS